MAGRCLLYRHEELSLGPQHPQKKPDAATQNCNLSAGGGEGAKTEESHLSGQPASLAGKEKKKDEFQVL